MLRSPRALFLGRDSESAYAHRTAHAAILLVSFIAAGCARPDRTLESAFPVAAQASPWVLRDNVWAGPAADAASAIGDDWGRIQVLEPMRAWFAVYQHESLPLRTITVRGFQFPTADRARAALDALCPQPGETFNIGDAGRWTELGLLFVHGELLFEFFGNDTEWRPEWQCAFLAGIIEKRLPQPAKSSAP